MSSYPMSHTDRSVKRTTLEQDLLRNLLVSEATSPWSVMDIDTLATSDTEDNLNLFESVDSVLVQGAQAFFTQLDTFWSEHSTSVMPSRSNLFQDLVQKFGIKIPPVILTEIVQQAEQSLASSQTSIDAAILCVKNLLPQWSLEDLQVFNRPLSYAMRSPQPAIEMALYPLQTKNWEELSEFDQVRVYLAIAHYTLGRIAAEA